MHGPDTSAQDALAAQQRADLEELKRKEAEEKKKLSNNQARNMRRSLGGSLLDQADTNRSNTLG